METAYAERYRDLYLRHWWWRAREHLIVSTLRSLAPAQGWPSILDVGCGDGLFFDRLTEFGDVEGVESEAGLVDPAGRWASRIRIQPFDETFQPRKQYGLITMLDVVEHLPDAGAALRRAASLLEPAGTLLVTVPAFQSLWTSHDDFNHHVQRFTRKTLARLTEQAGRETVATRYFFFSPPPPKCPTRLKKRVLRGPSQMARVPGPFANHAMSALAGGGIAWRARRAVAARTPLRGGGPKRKKEPKRRSKNLTTNPHKGKRRPAPQKTAGGYFCGGITCSSSRMPPSDAITPLASYGRNTSFCAFVAIWPSDSR